MSKSKKTIKTIDLGSLDRASAILENIFEPEVKPFTIKKAEMKDGICNYSYETNTGVHKGDVVGVKGTALFLDDMRDAFVTLHVHLACLDEVFKHAGVEITDIDTMHGHDFTFLYHVSKIEIKGDEENEGIILSGTKLTDLGRMDVNTVKVMFHNSSYQWYNELKAASDNVRREVELYIGGKCEQTEEDEKPDPKQTAMDFNADQNEDTKDIFEGNEA